ncbi:MAG: 4Fe-4S dicluster domain-containing protein [Chloroflexi bacterium]|nr:4Fe-4S dicluster domain-containing protein [Chloroflexota bacterium]
MANNGRALALDPLKCTGCHSCEVACSTAREGASSLVQSRIRITAFEAEDFNCPIVCQQCQTPYCALVCPTRALVKNAGTGIVDWIQAKCVGCKMCLVACPFGALNMAEGGKVLKCDLCSGDPVCVRFCQPGALSYTSLDEIGGGQRVKFAQTMKQAQLKEA